MSIFYIVITVVAGLFFVGSGVLLPLFELVEQRPGRRKVRGPTSSPTTPPITGSASVAGSASAPAGEGAEHSERIAA